MTRNVTTPALQLIRRVGVNPRFQKMADEELLARFCANHDEEAFQALVKRHGSMVLEVSRGVLGNDADAEDVFQATFLVLAQKASAIRKGESLGSWLYGVAYRTALNAQRMSARRKKHESLGSDRRAAEAAGDLAWSELRRILYEELTKIARCYQAPLVLCYLEGMTQDRAAAVLGVSKATVRKRLDQGRALLRLRLVRRGLGPVAVLLAAAWPLAAARALPAAQLVSSTVRAATQIAAGRVAPAGLVSTKVAALAAGVLKTMHLTKLNVAAAVLLALALTGAGSVVVSCHARAAEQTGTSSEALASQASTNREAGGGALAHRGKGAQPQIQTLTAQADPPKEPVTIDKALLKTTGPSTEKTFDQLQAEAEQRELKRQFLEFRQALLRLAQNLELSGKPANQDKAAILRKALEQAREKGVDSKFNKLIELLRSPQVKEDLIKLGEASKVNEELRRDLATLLKLLESDNRAAFLAKERKRTEKLLEAIKDLIRRQERLRAMTEQRRGDTKDIAKNQGKVANSIKDLIGQGKGNKSAESKKGQAKDNPGKDGRGAAKKDTSKDKGSKGASKSSGKSGSGKASQGGGKSGSSGKGDSKQGQQQQQPPQDSVPARKQIEDAGKSASDAEDKLKDKDLDNASAKQDDTIKKLEEAKKKLEELLRQIREEEVERLLAALQQRCEDMLRLQIQVYDGTVDVHARIKGTMTRPQIQKASDLGVIENDIVKMAKDSIKLLEAEGSAVTFAVAFRVVRDDMIKVADRLSKRNDVGVITQNTERYIINNLKMMIEALKKARKGSKKPSKPGQPGKPPEDDLIDLLAELKILRSMQVQVNDQTKDYHKFYPGLEQAPDPATIKDPKEREQMEAIQAELKGLAERQQQLEKTTKDLANGKNKTKD